MAFRAFIAPAESLRFLGELVRLSEAARPEPKIAAIFRFVPEMTCAAKDFSSTGGFLGFGPKTPRHDSVPHRHS